MIFNENTIRGKMTFFNNVYSSVSKKIGRYYPLVLLVPVNFILSFPRVFSFVNQVMRGSKGIQRYASECIRAKDGDKVLDIGCGPENALQYLPDVDYCGFDLDPTYIKVAKARYPTRGKFYCKKVSSDAIKGEGSFDIIISVGVIHHLNDDEARQLFALAYHLLKPGGRLVTHDGCYRPGQSWIERFFLDIDRGRHIRTETEYRKLVCSGFTSVSVDIRLDLLLIPQSTIVFTCTR